MLKPYNLWLIFADFFIYPWRHWYMGHSQGGGGWGATCFTHHICQELLSTSKKPYLSQKRSHWNTQFPLSTINCGGMEKWVNHETYRLLTREAQPDRSCNPLSSDDIRPIIPMPGQVDLRSPFRCSEVFYQDLFESACLGWRECYSWEFFGLGVLVNTDIQQSLNALRAPNSLEGRQEAARYIKCPKTVWENYEFL